jgi:hypothetical protein
VGGPKYRRPCGDLTPPAGGLPADFVGVIRRSHLAAPALQARCAPARAARRFLEVRFDRSAALPAYG